MGDNVAVAFNLRALITGGKQASQMSHEPNVKDLAYMKELIEAGEVVPVIDKSYPLSEIAEAFRYFEEDHPTGKVVITVKHEENANILGSPL